jgi:cbb3-type cytochrome c oxidase subunit III
VTYRWLVSGGLVAVIVAVIAGCGGGGAKTAKVSAEVGAGAHDYVQFGCGQCHGKRGRGGVSNYVPALTVVGKVLTEARLRQIIDHGLGESQNPTRPYMPVWGGVIPTRKVSELVAYIHAGFPAVPGATPVRVPTDKGLAAQGKAIYVQDGCVNCHGQNGRGGVPNPQSPDKTIPPLSGKDFFKEFNTDKKILDVIRSGSVIGRAPIVSMPHWGGILSQRELKALVAFIKTLNTQ